MKEVNDAFKVDPMAAELSEDFFLKIDHIYSSERFPDKILNPDLTGYIEEEKPDEEEEGEAK